MEIRGLRDYRAAMLGRTAAEFLRRFMPACEDTPEAVDHLKSPEGDDGSAANLLCALADYRLGPAIARTAEVDPNVRDTLSGALRLWATFHPRDDSVTPDPPVIGFSFVEFFEAAKYGDGAVEGASPSEAEAANMTLAERALVDTLKHARCAGAYQGFIDGLDEELIGALRQWAHAHPRVDDRVLVRVELAELLDRAARSIDEQIADGDIETDYPDSADAYELGRTREGFVRIKQALLGTTGPVERMDSDDVALVQAAVERVNDEIERDLETGDIDSEEDRDIAELQIAAYKGIAAQAPQFATAAVENEPSGRRVDVTPDTASADAASGGEDVAPSV